MMSLLPAKDFMSPIAIKHPKKIEADGTLFADFKPANLTQVGRLTHSSCLTFIDNHTNSQFCSALVSCIVPSAYIKLQTMVRWKQRWRTTLTSKSLVPSTENGKENCHPLVLCLAPKHTILVRFGAKHKVRSWPRSVLFSGEGIKFRHQELLS